MLYVRNDVSHAIGFPTQVLCSNCANKPTYLFIHLLHFLLPNRGNLMGRINNMLTNATARQMRNVALQAAS